MRVSLPRVVERVVDVVRHNSGSSNIYSKMARHVPWGLFYHGTRLALTTTRPPSEAWGYVRPARTIRKVVFIV